MTRAYITHCRIWPPFLTHVEGFLGRGSGQHQGIKLDTVFGGFSVSRWNVDK